MKDMVQFSRYSVPVEIRFQGGMVCCEWCNMSYINPKRHYECSLTHEEMISPKDSIGWDCPLREVEAWKSNSGR